MGRNTYKKLVEFCAIRLKKWKLNKIVGPVDLKIKIGMHFRWPNVAKTELSKLPMCRVMPDNQVKYTGQDSKCCMFILKMVTVIVDCESNHFHLNHSSWPFDILRTSSALIHTTTKELCPTQAVWWVSFILSNLDQGINIIPGTHLPSDSVMHA